MKTTLIAALSLSAGAVACAGVLAPLELSTGSLELVGGDTYAYAIARGDSVLTITDAGFVGSGAEPIDPAYHASFAGISTARAGVIVAGAAQLIFHSGIAERSVIAIGDANAWLGPGVGLEELITHERAAATLQGDPARPIRASYSFGDSLLVLRDAYLTEEAFSHDNSTTVFAGGDLRGDLNSYQSSRIELHGGRVRGWAESWDDSDFVMTDGYVDGFAVSNDHSRFILAGGSVASVWPRSEHPFVMTAGEVRAGVVAGHAFHASGGSILGDVSGDSLLLRFDVRSAAFDHDADPDTPGEPLLFADDGTIVITPHDARLRPVGGSESADLMLPGVAVVWPDGSETAFTIRMSAPAGADDPRRIEFHRALLPEDLNADGGIDVLDLAIMLGQWGGPGSADFNGDGIVDVLDLVRLVLAWENN